MAGLIRNIKAAAALSSGLALALLAGCRNLDNAQIDVLERELRQQEDYIYELEDYLVEYSEKLRHARVAACDPATTARPAKPAAPKTPTLDVDPSERPSLPLNGRNKQPAPPKAEIPPTGPETPPVTEPQPETVKPEEMEPPELEFGPGVGMLPWKSKDSPAEAPVFGGAMPLAIPDPVDYQADAELTAAAEGEIQPIAEAAAEPLLAAPEVNASRLTAEKLQIRRIFSQSASEEARSPASLLVVVEALNATNEPVDATGEASLMIMARDAPGSFQKIDRWDFSPDETKAAWQSSHLGDGLHLELPLGDKVLPEGELELWARVVSADGKKLLTQFAFDPTQLASIDEAGEAAGLAGGAESEEKTQAEVAPLEEVEVEEPATAEAAPPAQWRTSSIKLDPNRVEGFASTAGGKSSGWVTQPNGGSQPRVAAAPGKTSSPAWQRSSTAQAQSESRPDWTPDR